MADRTRTYRNVTRKQLQNIRQALHSAGIDIRPDPFPTLHSLAEDAGTFSQSGYRVSYSFTTDAPDSTTGTLTVKVSGGALFIGTAEKKIDGYMKTYLV